MEQKKNYSYFLIRHGQSEQNEYDQAGKGYRPHPNGELVDEYFLDSPLTQLGFEQAKPAQEALKNIDIGLVIVSPLKRALQTATEVFKDHPSQPIFRVDPDAREMLAGASTVPGDINKLIKEYPSFDFSAFDSFEDKECWLAEAFEDKEFKETLLAMRESVKEEPDRNLAFSRLVLKEMEKISPVNFESPKVLQDRGKKFGKKMNQLIQSMEVGKKVALVSHYSIILHMYSTEYNERGWAKDGISLKNCEVKEYEL